MESSVVHIYAARNGMRTRDDRLWVECPNCCSSFWCQATDLGVNVTWSTISSSIQSSAIWNEFVYNSRWLCNETLITKTHYQATSCWISARTVTWRSMKCSNQPESRCGHSNLNLMLIYTTHYAPNKLKGRIFFCYLKCSRTCYSDKEDRVLERNVKTN